VFDQVMIQKKLNMQFLVTLFIQNQEICMLVEL
jgi:hypothetical protein